MEHIVRIAPFVLALTVGGLAACGGGNQIKGVPEYAAQPTRTPVVTAAPTTVPSTTTTAAPPPTTTALTTVPPLAAPAPTEVTTVAPAVVDPPPLFSGQATESDVRAAMDPLYAAWNACSADPFACETTNLAVEGTVLADSIRERTREAAAEGRYFEPHPETTYSIEDVVVLASDLVKVRVCYVDYGWRREMNETPQHDDDVVLDDRITAYRSEAVLRRLPDGRVLFDDYNRLFVWERETSCPAA